ncbi:MAG: N-acetylmuramoyl-L-alanine amidase [Desulfovibrio sp.]|nr:N-acetylmuramoyl-L-alanine amidase [Desulfovibrio sp.]
MNKEYRKGAFLRRAAPPLAFILAISLLVVFCYDAGHTSLPPTEKRYVAAKGRITAVRQDEKKNMQRDAWEKLAAEFRSIYDSDPDWPNRPAALFKAAESLEELARRSCARADARKAVSCYESVALRHAESRLADDALLRAAQIRAAMLKDDKGALALIARIKKQYPKGDKLAEAAALEKVIRASANGKTDPEALKTLAKSASLDRDEPPRKTAAPAPAKSFAGDLPLRLRAARARAKALANDALRSCWRQPWEDLRDEFLRIHQSGRASLATEALFGAAEAQKSLALCSRVSSDSKKARDLYLRVAKDFPGHNLADDAMLAAARLQYAQLAQKTEATATLNALLKKWPKGDMAPQAKRLLAIWNQTGQAIVQKKREKPELQVLSWNSPNKNSVQIILELSKPAQYQTRLEKKPGNAASLMLELADASVVSDVRKGVTVQGSLLKAVRVQDRKDGGATLQFDFREVRKFDARSESDPSRIILDVAAGAAQLPKKKQATLQAAAKKSQNIKFKTTQVCDIASQLGLTVKRVFIDAGHGGKDPGTSHNKIVEKAITLDVALTLGGLLEDNGFEVIYSRKQDKTVGLSERTRMANAAKADLFVSIHVNANDNPSANGFETYYLDLASNQQAARVAMLENSTSDKRLSDMQSMLAQVMLHAKAGEAKNLAADIHRVSLFRLKKRDYATRGNGVKSAPFHVLLGARMPAVLIELGYCSNGKEAANLASPKYRHALAEGIAESILAYRDRLLRNRTAGAEGKKKGSL